MKINASDLAVAQEQLRISAAEISALEPAKLSSFESEKTMLVVVDIVNGFVREGAMASPRVEDIIPPAESLMRKCDAAGIKTAAFADCHNADCAEFASFPPHCIRGTSESELVDELKAVGGYTLIEKNSTNGFHEENFRKLLDDNRSVNNFIVIGDCTDICVLQFCLALKTYFTAADRQCRIVIPANCAETYDAPNHNGDFMNIAAYKIMSTCGIEFVSEII